MTGLVLALAFNSLVKSLRVYRIFLLSMDLPFKLFRESTSYFCFNPRQCFGSSSFPSLMGKKKRFLDRMEMATVVSGHKIGCKYDLP